MGISGADISVGLKKVFEIIENKNQLTYAKSKEFRSRFEDWNTANESKRLASCRISLLASHKNKDCLDQKAPLREDIFKDEPVCLV